MQMFLKGHAGFFYFWILFSITGRTALIQSSWLHTPDERQGAHVHTPGQTCTDPPPLRTGGDKAMFALAHRDQWVPLGVRPARIVARLRGRNSRSGRRLRPWPKTLHQIQTSAVCTQDHNHTIKTDTNGLGYHFKHISFHVRVYSC